LEPDVEVATDAVTRNCRADRSEVVVVRVGVVNGAGGPARARVPGAAFEPVAYSADTLRVAGLGRGTVSRVAAFDALNSATRTELILDAVVLAAHGIASIGGVDTEPFSASGSRAIPTDRNAAAPSAKALEASSATRGRRVRHALACGVAALAHSTAWPVAADAVEAVPKEAVAVGVACRSNAATLIDARRTVRRAAADRGVPTVSRAAAVLAVDGGFAISTLTFDVAAAGLAAHLPTLPVDWHLSLRALATAARVADLPALTVAAAAASVRVGNDGAVAGIALGRDIAEFAQAATCVAETVLATVRAVCVALAFDTTGSVAAA
jgi:hypothetical protein